MTRTIIPTALLGALILTIPTPGAEIPLDSVEALKLNGVSAAVVEYRGKRAMRITHTAGEDGHSLAILPGIAFTDGVIEYEFAGDVKPDSPPSYRGFTGLAFRVSAGGESYECFYQRPLNSRSPNAEQRRHTVQYISMPGYGWRALREQFPGKYENWADIQPGAWTKVKIEVRGKTARLSIGGGAEPVLTVTDLRQEALRGTLALWVDIGTVAHFANLRITR